MDPYPAAFGMETGVPRLFSFVMLGPRSQLRSSTRCNTTSFSSSRLARPLILALFSDVTWV
jgi:hypothetical protein